jgi:AraC-like DNA-binding protein
MQKISWDTSDLPAALEERARFHVWRDIFVSTQVALDLRALDDRPFRGRFEAVQLGPFRIGQFNGTLERLARTAKALATDGNDDFCIALNLGRSPMQYALRDREVALPSGAQLLLSNGRVSALCADDDNAWIVLNFPSALLHGRVSHAEDVVGTRLDPNLAAVRHLRRYLEMLAAPPGIEDDPVLLAHITATLTDLIALALGAGRDAAQIARMRGLRAARVQEIIGEIRARFADPAFTPQAAASRIGLSARYLQDLLQETGSSFTERIMELRLQKARAMLEGVEHAGRRISDIAFDCGFAELSHFSRTFRARFGASPVQFRRSKTVQEAM